MLTSLRDNIHHSLRPKLLYYMNVTTYQDVTYISFGRGAISVPAVDFNNDLQYCISM